MLYYLVYCTTNLTNNKIYVGMHKTHWLNDGYLGSGTLISRAIAKYGKEAFQREILFTYDNPEEMVAKERELVTKEFVDREDTYNLSVGGKGSWYQANKLATPEQKRTAQRASTEARKQLGLADPHHWDKWRAVVRGPMSKALKASGFKLPLFKRPHTQETKAKISAALKISQAGNKNNQYGTVWVYQEGSPRPLKIPGKDLGLYLDSGWKRGRGLPKEV